MSLDVLVSCVCVVVMCRGLGADIVYFLHEVFYFVLDVLDFEGVFVCEFYWGDLYVACCFFGCSVGGYKFVHFLLEGVYLVCDVLVLYLVCGVFCGGLGLLVVCLDHFFECGELVLD